MSQRRHSSLGRLAAASVLGCTLAGASAAQAADTWTEPHPGLRHLYRTTGAPLRIHAIVADLCTPGVGVRATKPGEKGQTPSAFGQAVNAEVAVNGDFFNLSTFVTTGLAVGDGVRWTDTDDTTEEGAVAFGLARAIFSRPGEVLDGPPEGVSELVSGRPLIVRDGAVVDVTCASHYCDLNPRTGVGFSRDRRTLFVAVVDGRSSVSEGVTVEGLGAILHSLGAHDALNLDGGGSSAMWIKSDGVVNAPSDGSQRVVANHLALHGNGIDAGMARSCVEDGTEEALATMHELDGLATSDVDGDGQADACARAAAGFRCRLASAAADAEPVKLDDLSDEAGFDDAANFSTIRMGDLDGDRLSDVCARTDAGIRCWRSGRQSFGAGFDGPALTDEAGWGAASAHGTLRLADVDGDGDDDLCGRGPAGFACWRSTGASFEATPLEGPALTDEAGWSAASRFGTIRMGDVDGDGRVDMCGRAAEGMRCWLSDGDALTTEVEGPAWSDASGWGAMKYWSTIRLADVDGDGRADLCGRASDGFRCHLSTGDGFGTAVEGPALSDEAGWGDQANYLTLRMTDLDGDGARDLCGRSDTGISCWRWTGGSFGPPIAGPALSDASGWYAHKYFRTLRFADIDGDGREDLCARAAAGVRCWSSTGDGFAAQATVGPTWSDESGWGLLRYYGTIRIAGPQPEPTPGGGGGGGSTGASGSGGEAGVGGESSGRGGSTSRPDDDDDGGALVVGAGGAAGDGAEAADGGCGCGVPRRPRPAHPLAIGAALALLAASRRRGARQT